MTEIKCKYDELKDPQELVSHPRNRNMHPIEQLERLGKIIEYNGFRIPIIISKRSGFIVSGHGRRDASLILKMEHVPVVYQDFTSEAEEYQFLIADNEIARWSELDKHGILNDFKEFELEKLVLPDLELFGLSQGQEDFFKMIMAGENNDNKKEKDNTKKDKKNNYIECPSCGESFIK